MIIILYIIYKLYYINKETFIISSKKIIILHTTKSYRYANKICLNVSNKCIESNTKMLDKKILSLNTSYNNLIIHPRTATPFDTVWINYLKILENKGVIVVNPTKLLQLTSNKLECSFVLYNNGINHPKTWKGYKNKTTLYKIKKLLIKHKKLIIIPSNSISQGAYVKQLYHRMGDNKIWEKMLKIPSDPLLYKSL